MTLRGGAAPPGCPAAASPLRPAGRGREGPGQSPCPPLSSPPPPQPVPDQRPGAGAAGPRGARTALSLPCVAREAGPAHCSAAPAALRPGTRLSQNSRKGKPNSNSFHRDTRGGETLTVNVPRSANKLLWTEHSYGFGHLALDNVGGRQGWSLGRCGVYLDIGFCAVPFPN